MANKNNELLVSIITPCYNASRYISETIESALKQSYKNFEMLIIDDCSTDKSATIIKSYQKKDNRIKYIKLEKKGGASLCRNRGILEAKGKYVAFLDSDDLWNEDKLAKQVDYMQKNNIAFCYSDYNYIDSNSESLNIMRKCPKKVSYLSMLLGNSIGCLTVIYDSEKTGLIQIPKLDKRNDYALWCKILKDVRVGYKYDEILASYRKNDSSLSSGGKVKLLKYHYQMHRKVNKFNCILSSFLTITNGMTFLCNKLFREKTIK